jgi:4-hydroxybenzoyl-CoA reductase subunit alpha
MEEQAIIGARLPRRDGWVKATGEAQYAGDMVLPRMLHGAILRSPLPHARIRNIDTSRALRLRGVRAVVTGQDTLGRRYNVLRFKEAFADEYGLAMDKVRFIGDAVAAVAATDEDTAQEALALIQVDYEELPAVFDPLKAMEPGAPLLHEHLKSNIGRKIVLDFGDVEDGFARSYHVREDHFTTQTQSHTPLEGHACLASYDPHAGLTVWTSTQVPYQVKNDLAYTLGLPESQVRVILPYVGGGFGGKSDGMATLDFCASLLSMKTGCPVRIRYGREEEFVAGRRRHPVHLWLKTGVAKDGTILAREVRCIMDGGAYNAYGPASVLLVGIFLNLPYRYKSYRYHGYRVYTNKPVASAMRGHGAPQGHFASDTQLDMIAQDIGMDPLEIRLRNALETGETTLNGFKILSSAFADCIRRAAAEAGWMEKRGKLPPNRGIGIGCSGFPSGTGFRQRPDIPTYSSAMIRINEDASLSLLSGAVDTGQGAETVMLQIAAHELGVDPDYIHYIRADTAITPADLGNFASRETVFAGNATRAAAAEVKSQLLEVAADELEANPADLELKEGHAYVRGSPERRIPFRELAMKAMNKRQGQPIVGRGSYDPPDKLNYATYTFGAQVVEVEVDQETGQVQVLNVASAHDGGQAINPTGVEGQLEGSIHMALGFALTEELEWDGSSPLNASLESYRVPAAVDMPATNVVTVDSLDPEGPYGAKEAGEGTIGPTAPAIANALADATGVRIKDLPLTPERVLEALNKRSST